MSTWHTPKLTDMEIVDGELHIFIKQDYFGSNYFAVNIDDIRKLLKKYDEIEALKTGKQ
jgi:hypothetical protein